MIKFVYAADLDRCPRLAEAMFRDRADQFKARLNWNVSVDADGFERDQYDDARLNPLYVIATDEAGDHVGSGRLMPTTGRTMLKEHFSHLADGVEIESPLIWEMTRFCVSPRHSGSGARRVPAALICAGYALALEVGVEFVVGVFDAQMLRVYRATGAEPEVLGRAQDPSGEICAGLWEITPQSVARVARRAGGAPKIEFVSAPETMPMVRPMSAPVSAARINARHRAAPGRAIETKRLAGPDGSRAADIPHAAAFAAAGAPAGLALS